MRRLHVQRLAITHAATQELRPLWHYLTAAEASFLELLEQHKGILYKVTNAYCRDREDRHDLVQEIALQLWRSFHRYDGRSRFSTWMYRIAMNIAISHYRRVLIIELLMGIATLILIAMFVGEHVQHARYLVPAAVLHLFVVAHLASTAHQLIALHGVDYAAPIVFVQRTLTRIAMLRIRTTKWTLILAPLLWTPMLIVMLKAFLGLDAYAVLDTAWLVSNVLFGAALIPLMLWAAPRYRDRAVRSPLLRRLIDDLAGSSLNEARAFVDRLAGLERDEP